MALSDGETLKIIRKHIGMTQQEFADALGMSREMVYGMEGGKRRVEKRTMLAARYLAMSYWR